MDDFINEFNEYFKGDATIIIQDNELKITIGSRTLILSLSSVVGMDATD